MNHHLLAVVVLITACCGSALATHHDEHHRQPTPQKQQTKTAPPLKLAPGQAVVYVDDLHCAGCARKVARKIFGVKGVVRVETNVKANRAVITPQAKAKLSGPAIWSAVQKAGFRPVKLIGPEGVYTADKKTGGPVLAAKPAKPARTSAAR